MLSFDAAGDLCVLRIQCVVNGANGAMPNAARAFARSQASSDSARMKRLIAAEGVRLTAIDAYVVERWKIPWHCPAIIPIFSVRFAIAGTI
jgi:hypothetical protein